MADETTTCCPEANCPKLLATSAGVPVVELPSDVEAAGEVRFVRVIQGLRDKAQVVGIDPATLLALIIQFGIPFVKMLIEFLWAKHQKEHPQIVDGVQVSEFLGFELIKKYVVNLLKEYGPELAKSAGDAVENTILDLIDKLVAQIG